MKITLKNHPFCSSPLQASLFTQTWGRTQLTISSPKSVALMKPILLLVLGFILFFDSSKAQTVVIIEGGTDAKTAQSLQEKTQTLLQAVNGNAAFPADPGVGALQSILSAKNLFSPLDTIGTVVIRTGKEYELPRFFLQKKGGKAYETTELVLRFNASLQLAGVQESSVKRNIDRILSRNLVADASEQANIDAVIKTYIDAFEQKNLSALSSLYSDESSIIVGTKSRSFAGFDIVRNDIQDYLSRTAQRTFVAGNKISLQFESPRYLRHPDLEHVYGFTAKQNWTTTSYSDVGYIFFILDLSDVQKPIVELRQWQENEFVASRFSDFSPDPLLTKISVSSIGFNPDSITNEYKSILNLRVQSTDSTMLSSAKVIQLLRSGALQVQGMNVMDMNLDSKDSSNVVLTYKAEHPENYDQVNPVTVVLKESGNLQGLRSQFMVYPYRITELSLFAFEKETQPEPHIELQPFATLHLQTEQDSVEMTAVDTSNKKPVFTQQILQKDFRMDLLKGKYEFRFSKNGFISQVQSFDLQTQKDTTFVVALAPVPVAPIPVEQAIVASTKWWLWGTAAILTGGALAYLLAGDNASPGIPVPPGRPVGM